jgi:hypothetical protein
MARLVVTDFPPILYLPEGFKDVAIVDASTGVVLMDYAPAPLVSRRERFGQPISAITIRPENSPPESKISDT